MHKYFTTIFILFFLSGVSQENHSFDKRSVDLNNKAVSLITTGNFESALLLLDSAIKMDSSYYVAYLNKVNIHCGQKDFQKAIESNVLALRQKPDLAESITFLGMLYDKNGESEKARQQYQLAIEVFDMRLMRSDKDQNANKVNRGLALLLLDPEKGKTEIKKLLKDNSNDITLRVLEDFEKEKYLNEIFNN